jgi:SNF2 family DNA or RNA helicase
VGAARVAASHALTADFDVPVPEGIDPLTGKPFAFFGFQLAGVKYAIESVDTLLADEMGVGKTLQAIGVSNADKLCHRVLVLCPAFLKDNWSEEWRKWDVKKLALSVIRKRKTSEDFPPGDVIIASHEVIESWRAELRAITWDLLIVDECHYLKNKKAGRTQEILGCRKFKEQEFIAPIKARRRLFMSGTPMLNKPRELWTIIKAFDPKGLGSNQMAFDKQ